MPKPKPLYTAHEEAGNLRTLRDAQNRGVLVATGFGKDPDIQFAITRHKFDYAVEPEKRYMESKKRPGVTYALHEITSLASGVRPDDPLTFVGYMNFLLSEDTREAEVMFTEINDKYRGKGLGLLLYKSAINDLVESRYEIVSDYVRSEDAERVWQSIRRDNPDEVRVISRPHHITDESFSGGGIYVTRPAYYTVGEFIGRRPVHVRGHWRRV